MHVRAMQSIKFQKGQFEASLLSFWDRMRRLAGATVGYIRGELYEFFWGGGWMRPENRT